MWVCSQKRVQNAVRSKIISINIITMNGHDMVYDSTAAENSKDSIRRFAPSVVKQRTINSSV